MSRLLPRIVVHLLDKLIASVVTHLLKQLTKQVGQQRTRCDHALVWIGITVIQRDLLAVGQQQPANHRTHQHHAAGI